MDKPSTKNVVLVHGGFVDGAGWEGVYEILKKNGYNVSIVQNPTKSLADDVAYTKQVLAKQDAPAILVGHSYGGAVITEAGNDPKVAGLVHHSLRSRQRRIRAEAHLDLSSQWASTTHPASTGRLLAPRQGQVSRLLRRGRGTRQGCVHGRLAGPMECGSSQRRDQRARVEGKAELVLGRH
jgi:pimeloyl-ACP methyl ester carboxylesterase